MKKSIKSAIMLGIISLTACAQTPRQHGSMRQDGPMAGLAGNPDIITKPMLFNGSEVIVYWNRYDKSEAFLRYSDSAFFGDPPDVPTIIEAATGCERGVLAITRSDLPEPPGFTDHGISITCVT